MLKSSINLMEPGSYSSATIRAKQHKHLCTTGFTFHKVSKSVCIIFIIEFPERRWFSLKIFVNRLW